MDNLAEWNGGQPLGLRTVHAYVLVFDMGNLATFQVSGPHLNPIFTIDVVRIIFLLFLSIFLRFQPASLCLYFIPAS